MHQCRFSVSFAIGVGAVLLATAAGGRYAYAAGYSPLPASDSTFRTRFDSVPGFRVSGTPRALNRVSYVEYSVAPRAGAASLPPRAVVILVPGYMGGAGNFRYVGERMIARLPWVKVWAVERRNNLLENRSAMRLARQARDPRLAATYYLQGKDLPGCPLHSSPGFALSQARAAALGMGRWRLEVQLNDLRLLVARAHARYPHARVFLGGHSLGGMTAQLYAGWRFGTTPDTDGWRSVDGLLLIDGGVDGPNWSPLLIGQYARDRRMLEAGKVYWDDPSIGAAPSVAQMTEIAVMAASLEPSTESFLWHSLPRGFEWEDPLTAPTNKALFAALSDSHYGKHSDFLLQQGLLTAPMGRSADGARSLVGWVDFDRTTPPELCPTDVWARSLWEDENASGMEWYFSVRLNADVDLASNLDSQAPFRDPSSSRTTTAAQLEGHREWDTARVALPVYAFASSEGRARFDWYHTAAPALTDFTLVDRTTAWPGAPAYTHLDPLFAADTGGFTNAFLSSAAEWLTAHTRMVAGGPGKQARRYSYVRGHGIRT